MGYLCTLHLGDDTKRIQSTDIVRAEERNVPVEGGLFRADLAINIVTSLNRVFESTTTEFLNAVFGGIGGPIAIPTVVASLWWRHITTTQCVLSVDSDAASMCEASLSEKREAEC